MSTNPKYLKGLTVKQKIEKTKNIKETKKLFQQGKKKEAAELAKKDQQQNKLNNQLIQLK